MSCSHVRPRPATSITPPLHYSTAPFLLLLNKNPQPLRRFPPGGRLPCRHDDKQASRARLASICHHPGSPQRTRRSHRAIRGASDWKNHFCQTNPIWFNPARQISKMPIPNEPNFKIAWLGQIGVHPAPCPSRLSASFPRGYWGQNWRAPGGCEEGTFTLSSNMAVR